MNGTGNSGRLASGRTKKQEREAAAHAKRAAQFRGAIKALGFKSGSLIDRGDRLYGRVTLDDGSYKYLYGRNPQEIENRARLLRETGEAETVDDRKLTLGAWLGQWLATLSTNGPEAVKQSTLDYYSRYVRVHVLNTRLAQKRLAAVTANDLRAFYEEKAAETVRGGKTRSSTTVHHLHAVLHRALKVAVREGKLAKNIAAAWDRPPKVDASKKMRALHEDDRKEISRFLSAAAGVEIQAEAWLDSPDLVNYDQGMRYLGWSALFTVAVSSGLRQGELLALRWTDLDTACAEIAVSGSLERHKDDAGNTVRTIGTTKTEKARQVAVPPVARKALIEHRRRQTVYRQRRQMLLGDWTDLGLVFPNERGDFMSTTTLDRTFKSILTTAELPAIRFHDLRHSAATWLLRKGVHPKLVSEMLGHSSINVTIDRYSHAIPAMHAEAVTAAWHDFDTEAAS